MLGTLPFPFCICIMAGGSGERFWPMSRASRPKHLIRLLSDRTLLEETVARALRVVPAERLFVLTNTAQLDATRAAIPDIPPQNIAAEPAKRDTAPATALATALARRFSPDAVCAVLPADAMIHNADAFARNLRDAARAAAAHPAFVTLGVKPAHAATGFGYLELAETLPPPAEGSTLRRVARFVEKPDAATARAYVEGGRHHWNAGIFLWSAATYLAEARRNAPDLAAFLEAFPASGPFDAFLAERFPALTKISVDYALMEKASAVVSIQADFDWDDVGAWTALPAHLGADARGNTVRGPVATHAADNCIVLSNGRTVALCGVRDLVVVETPDAILVCHRDAVQDVKKLQDQLPAAVR